MTIREFKVADQENVAKLQDEFMLEFFPEFRSDPRQYQWNADIYHIDEHYSQRGGRFWVIEEDHEIVGFGGFRLVSPTVAEIKRVRLRSSCRGKGLGKAIVETIEYYCREHKIAKILVDTDERLSIAKNMYARLGYVLIRKEEQTEGLRKFVTCFFEKDLSC